MEDSIDMKEFGVDEHGLYRVEDQTEEESEVSEKSGTRFDGYVNALTKYGTMKDSSTAYQWQREPDPFDMDLTVLYEGNGLFSKIIDRPAEEAVKHGLNIDFGDETISELVAEKLDELGYEENFGTAVKWQRLYGGSIIVMLIDDGGKIDEPVDWSKATRICELRVYDRTVVWPDYLSMYKYEFQYEEEMDNSGVPFGEPETYLVFSIYGHFRVHRSRCIPFRNGRMPEHTTSAIYRYWGLPEFTRMRKALRECTTSHEFAVKILERSSQAIYKMQGLATLLRGEGGDEKLIDRLQALDLSRNILATMAIDADGEDYDFKTMSTAGINEVLNSTCNMLSAVTNIPQTILFGRSPAGMNASGDADFENYYNMVENIQKQNMKKPTRRIIDIILKELLAEGKIDKIPKYKVEFASLWTKTEEQEAAIEAQKEQTKATKAQTAATYIGLGVLDPEEVRKKISIDGDYDVDEILDNVGEEDFEIQVDISEYEKQKPNGASDNATEENTKIEIEMPNVDDFGATAHKGETGMYINLIGQQEGCGVIIIKDGKILCAQRTDDGTICGPGGKIEPGETPEQAIIRETQEEFSITPKNLIKIGMNESTDSKYLTSHSFFTDEFDGKPATDKTEMVKGRWIPIDELMGMNLFPPFRMSLEKFVDMIIPKIEIEMPSEDGGPGSGNFGHKGRKGEIGGSEPNGGEAYGNMKSAVESVRERVKKNGKIAEADIHEAGKAVFDTLHPEAKISSELIEEKKTLDKQREELDKLGEAIKDAEDDDPSVSRYVAGVKKYNEAFSQYMDKRKQYAEKNAKAYSKDEFVKAMSSIRQLGLNGKNVDDVFYIPKKVQADEVAKATEILPTEWLEKFESETVRFKADTDREYCIGNVVHVSSETTSEIIAHELGHCITEIGGISNQAESEFYDRRTSGCQLEQLSKYMDAEDDELVKRDSFSDAYMGKYYEDGSHELLSMGLQAIMENPAALAEDPDFAEMIYGVLALC